MAGIKCGIKTMTDIIERLRDKAFIGGPTMDAAHTKRIEWEAADEIIRLREENARLRETLQYIADPYNNSTTSKDRLAFLARTAIRENDK